MKGPTGDGWCMLLRAHDRFWSRREISLEERKLVSDLIWKLALGIDLASELN